MTNTLRPAKPLRPPLQHHLHYAIASIAIIGCFGLFAYFTGGQEAKDLIKAAAIFFGSLIILAAVGAACTPRGGA